MVNPFTLNVFNHRVLKLHWCTCKPVPVKVGMNWTCPRLFVNAWCGKLLGRTNTVHEGSVHGDNKKTRTQDFVFLFVFGWCEQRVGIASRRYYGGDGSIFFTGFRVFGFHYFGDYNRLHVVHMYFYTLYKLHRHVCTHTYMTFMNVKVKVLCSTAHRGMLEVDTQATQGGV